MNHLFSIGLFIHIIGITCIAGGIIGGLVLENHIWKHVHQSPEKVSVLAPLMSKYHPGRNAVNASEWFPDVKSIELGSSGSVVVYHKDGFGSGFGIKRHADCQAEWK